MSEICTNSACSVHGRNDLTVIGEYDHPVLITYCGDRAVYTDTILDTERLSPSDRLRMAGELMDILASEDESEIRRAALEIVNDFLVSYTYIYTVGEGTIDQAIADHNSECIRIEHAPEESSDIHFREVNRIEGIKNA
jgi:hypothetical protein